MEIPLDFWLTAPAFGAPALRELLRLDCPRKLAARTFAPLPAPLKAVTFSVGLLATVEVLATGRLALVLLVTAVLAACGCTVLTLAVPTEELAVGREVLVTAAPTVGAEDRGCV